jgi:sugar phosphate permease
MILIHSTAVRTQRWLLVAPALLLLWIVAQIDKTNVSLLIADPRFLADLDVAGKNAELGGLMSAFFLGYGLSIPIWGFLVDRFGPRLCAIAGSLAWGVLLLLSARASDINHYLLIRFLLGAAEGNLWPVCNALTNRWFPLREHSRVQAFWLAGTTIGTASGVPLTTILMLQSDWRGALTALALLSLLPMILFFFVGDRPSLVDQPREAERLIYAAGSQTGAEPVVCIESLESTVSLGALVRTKAFWLVTIAQAISATTVYTLIQWIPSYLANGRHLSLRAMGIWITLGYLVAALATVVAGYAADRAMKRALTASIASLAGALLILPAAWLPSAFGCAVALATLSSIGTITASLNGALMHTMVKGEAIARATGVYVGIGNFSSAVGPVVFGYLISAFGGLYWGGFLFLVAINIVGAIVYFLLHRIAVQASPETGDARAREAIGTPVPN